MIACWFYRHLIARFTDATALPRSAQRHLEKCAACRESFDFEREIARGLVAEAESQHQPVSPFLHSRIMANLERRPQVARASLRPAWAAVLAIAMVGILGVFLLVRNSQNTSAVRLTARTVSHQPPANNTSVAPGKNILELTRGLERPLESEMQSVVSDAKAAIQLLAHNFLPENSDRSLDRSP
jgi:hypothetical protein